MMKLIKYISFIIKEKEITRSTTTYVHTSEQIHTTPTLTSNITTQTSLTNNNNNIPNTHQHSQHTSHNTLINTSNIIA